jgi:trigger factor
VKVTTERMPKSLIALDIELAPEQVEKGLDRAARRFSQKYNVPGFRKGKAPRFIIENYFGRAALMEEATEDLVNKSFKEALEQEHIDPVGPASLETVSSTNPFTYRVLVPVSPTVTLGDYRAIRVESEPEAVTDEMVERSLEALREKHVVLQELEEARPAKQGDHLILKLESIVDGEPLEERDENEELPDTPVDLEPGRLVDELYEALLGTNIDDEVEVTAQMPEDHANEQVRGKQVTFKAKVINIQERLLPEWEDLPALENVEGSIDDLRTKTRTDLETAAKNVVERKITDGFIDQLVESTTFDIPDVMIENLADNMLHDQGRQFERYGITLEQMLQYRGKTHDEAVEELKPDAERQTKITLALQQVSRNEQLTLDEDEIEAEVVTMLNDYAEDQRESVGELLRNQMRGTVANVVLDRKLRERLIAIATGSAPELEKPAEDAPESEAVEAEPVESDKPS